MKLIHFSIAVIIMSTIFTVPASSQAAASGPKWEDTTYDRPEQYSSFTTEKDVFITMRDGIILAADVHLPDGPGPFPVILTQTPYNKNVSSTENLNEDFIKRGYAHVVVDVRGTGASQGAWDSFGEAEQRDGKELVEWAAAQPWSNGKVGLYGSSYRAINQLLTAAQHPDGLEAIFPIVPMGDMYRDILMSGGLVNTGFIPLWLGLVTGSGLLPPSYTLSDPIMGTTVLLNHTGQTLGFPVSTLSSAITGGDFAYDGPAAQLRSPLAVADQIEVPAFFTGGLHDLFQRGTPLLYEKLKANGVQTKLLMGNWTHGNYGSGLPADNVPALDQLALRWFDQYLMGINTQINKIPDVTQFVLGEGRFEVQPGWPHKNVAAQKFYLRSGNLLTKERPSYAEPSQTMLQQPLNGICSGSTNQWMAGIPDALPCTKDNRLTEMTELTYTTPPANTDLRVSGPISAKIFAKTTARDLVLSVRVTDVAPDGTSNEITAGWLAASHRAVDESKSRFLDGENIQPWHPFTRTAVQEVKPYEVMELDVEIFPSNFVIKEGHKLRVAVGPSDFPHSMSPLPQLLDQLGGFATILNNSKYPSSIVLPVVEE
ncbi:CocE/NonD family hydrolase [Bacillus sp. ISL-35]|uniref:CocE/NonD family hydrolase n=1 Tax=Bacillus sp. ISL-35 TaxID=2819122 RepID=UPI001BEB438C|nr:CocE/NonD family hydrolase [Bacillus sp. ISL-35]MBT2681270.1 CocE/NonD family hydrolase [Bacillus sp. ISL-35]MBT2705523.1 CocE/NonD family hydrolase [Chryseobacterium sp. ISL-80]